MADWQSILPQITTLTFDCYGTLIDWQAGLQCSLGMLFEIDDRRRLRTLFERYVATEMDVEAESYRPYREVLAETARRVAASSGLDLSPQRAARLAEMLPTWPAFPDTVEALARLGTRYRLGVLSNVDRDLFADTARTLGTSFDFVITAEDVRAYKPDLAHFRRLLDRHAKRKEVLHVAQSLLHDGKPARRIRLAFAWINRYKDANETNVVPVGEWPTLSALADALLTESE